MKQQEPGLAARLFPLQPDPNSTPHPAGAVVTADPAAQAIADVQERSTTLAAKRKGGWRVLISSCDPRGCDAGKRSGNKTAGMNGGRLVGRFD